MFRNLFVIILILSIFNKTFCFQQGSTSSSSSSSKPMDLAATRTALIGFVQQNRGRKRKAGEPTMEEEIQQKEGDMKKMSSSSSSSTSSSSSSSTGLSSTSTALFPMANEVSEPKEESENLQLEVELEDTIINQKKEINRLLSEENDPKILSIILQTLEPSKKHRDETLQELKAAIDQRNIFELKKILTKGINSKIVLQAIEYAIGKYQNITDINIENAYIEIVNLLYTFTQQQIKLKRKLQEIFPSDIAGIIEEYTRIDPQIDLINKIEELISKATFNEIHTEEDREINNLAEEYILNGINFLKINELSAENKLKLLKLLLLDLLKSNSEFGTTPFPYSGQADKIRDDSPTFVKILVSSFHGIDKKRESLEYLLYKYVYSLLDQDTQKLIESPKILKSRLNQFRYELKDL